MSYEIYVKAENLYQQAIEAWSKKDPAARGFLKEAITVCEEGGKDLDVYYKSVGKLAEIHDYLWERLHNPEDKAQAEYYRNRLEPEAQED